MCTAITYTTAEHYFGRNLDLEYSYEESVTVTPRNFPILFRMKKKLEQHYAMIGMAYVFQNYPFYYDATNEAGLSMAALSFEGNAQYYPYNSCKDNVTPYELILWVLAQCANLKEVKRLLRDMNIVDLPFCESLPNTPLHWMISDKEGSLVIESVREGFKMYDNPIGVLTNNPPFEWQMLHLHNYMGLSAQKPVNHLAKQISLKPYSKGMGAMGLPGDLSSASRFVRASFVKLNAVSGESEEESVTQFFHILTSVEQQRGCVALGDEKYEITRYSSCCNTDRGIYYYRTYENNQIVAVDMHKEDLEQTKMISYPLITKQQIRYQN